MTAPNGCTGKLHTDLDAAATESVRLSMALFADAAQCMHRNGGDFAETMRSGIASVDGLIPAGTCTGCLRTALAATVATFVNMLRPEDQEAALNQMRERLLRMAEDAI